MLIGYAHVSTLDQKPALQIDVLKPARCEHMFSEKAIIAAHMPADWRQPLMVAMPQTMTSH
jgi:hypothetical protein